MAWLAGVLRSRKRLSRRMSWLTVPIFSPRASAARISSCAGKVGGVQRGGVEQGGTGYVQGRWDADR